ncbi:MAG: alpha-galactosidase [Clostridiaceae bacterium]
MAIIFNEKEKTFTLHTKSSTYQFIIGRYNYILHLYYGRRIEDQSMEYLLHYEDRGFSGNPYEAGRDRSFSLDSLPQEYPVFGNGDYRPSCLHLEHEDGGLDVKLTYKSHEIFSGKKKMDTLPSSYGREEQVDTLRVLLEDEVNKITVALEYSVFEEADIITRHAVIYNNSTEDKWLNRALSMGLDFYKGEAFDLISFYGKHNLERQLERKPIRHGITQIGSVRGTSSHQQNPFVILCDGTATEDSGECYGFSLMYSGNFIIEAEVDQINQTRLVAGIQPQGFRWKLHRGEAFETPEVILSYEGNGLGELSRKYHNFIKHHVSSERWKGVRRPILINNWEATYFDFTSDKLIDIAKDAKDMGIELLVMDDGWFGKRNDDYSGLGDWTVNEEKLPGGLQPLIKQINELGLSFGIWFEPEMVSEDSDLYRSHPDWCLKVPGREAVRSRYQLVLDITRAEVRAYLYESISKILRDGNISYVKWDMNRHLANIYSIGLPADRQGEIYHRYVLGLYELLGRLVTEFPEVLFEGCSGGGGRFDAGMLYYTPQIWCSDNTDAIDRLKIQYGTSFCYPISSVGAHVSVVPNHQTGRITPLATRGITAMAGTFGYELDLTKCTESEKNEIKNQVTVFKKYYYIFQEGNYHRLTEASDKENYVAWQFASEDKKTAILNYVLLKSQSNAPVNVVRLKGIDRRSSYKVQVLISSGDTLEMNNKMEGKIFKGEALMNGGFPIPRLYGDYASIQLAFEGI